MESKELRIGNWLTLSKDKTPKQVFSIWHDEEGRHLINDTPITLYDPIPLSPEILVKCGLVIDGDFDNHSVDYYRKDCLHIQFPNYEGWQIFHVWRDNCKEEDGLNKQYDVEVKYLHQLQNLYFALCGQDLPVTM